jgi:hypothetical protein
VPQGALHEARMHPSCAQLGGRGMPQGVDGPAHCGQAGPVCGSTAGALDTAPPHGGSCGRTVEVIAPGSRKEPGRVAVRFPGGAEQRQGSRRPGDVPVCGARAAVDMALEALAITVGTLQEEGAMAPQAHALDGGAGDLVVERGGGRQASPPFLHTEARGEMGGGVRVQERERGPVALEDMRREAAHTAGADPHGRGGEASDVCAVQEVCAQLLCRDAVGGCVGALRSPPDFPARGFLGPLALAAEVESREHVLT